MQAVLLLLLAVSLNRVCGNEDLSSLDLIRAVQALQTKVEELEKNQVKTVQDQVQTMAQVQSLVQQQNSSRVAFHAGFNPGDREGGQYGPFDMSTTIKFQNILTNFGNGYSSETGLFTAPLRGVYVFHLRVYSYKPSSASNFTSSYVFLKKNSETLIETFDTVSGPDRSDLSTIIAVVTMELGDTVMAELLLDYAFYDYHGRDTTFSGFLLFPL